MKKNKAEDYEPLNVFLTQEKTPIAYRNKVECLKLSGMSEEEACEIALGPIELELYYEVGHGLFAVEAEAVESGVIHSPYSGEELEEDENKEAIQYTTKEDVKISASAGIPLIELAYKLKAKIDQIARNGLIACFEGKYDTITIPKRGDHEYYSLAVLDMPYAIFYFQSMQFDGNRLSFLGVDEDDSEVFMDESELPDNGLLYLCDFIQTGCY